jgi:hypothetical protein
MKELEKFFGVEFEVSLPKSAYDDLKITNKTTGKTLIISGVGGSGVWEGFAELEFTICKSDEILTTPHRP